MTEPGPAGRDGPGLPEHEQQAWDAIVADLRGQFDLGPAFPADRSAPAPLLADGDLPDPLADPVDLDDDGEHRFVPPDPPPLPRPADTAARFSWAAVVGGPLLAVAAGVLGWDDWLVAVGVTVTITGFAALIARRPDHDDRDDDGAVV